MVFVHLIILLISAISAIFVIPFFFAADDGGTVLLGVFLMIFAFWLMFNSAIKLNARSRGVKSLKVDKNLEESWLSLVSTCDYKNYWSGYGIAINLQDKLLYLKSFFYDTPVEKQYLFDDIRKWEYRILSEGGIIAFGGKAAIGAAIANAGQKAKNDSESGFFVQVRDIDFPEWQIRFSPSSNCEIEMKRWMEILQQYINEK